MCVISNDDKQIPTNCFAKDICTPVTSKNLAETYPYLNSFQLADSNTDNRNLARDILKGVNFYWDIVLEVFLNWKPGPAALNKKVRYFLSGTIEKSHQEESKSVILTHVMKVQADIINSYNN